MLLGNRRPRKPINIHALIKRDYKLLLILYLFSFFTSGLAERIVTEGYAVFERSAAWTYFIGFPLGVCACAYSLRIGLRHFKIQSSF